MCINLRNVHLVYLEYALPVRAYWCGNLAAASDDAMTSKIQYSSMLQWAKE